MEAGELVRGEVVIGHAAIGVEILAIGTGVDGADRDDETQPIRRGDLASAPCLRQGKGGLGIDEAGIGPGQGLGADIVLLHPTEPAPRQRGDIGADDRFEADVTGFRQQDRAQRLMGRSATRASPSLIWVNAWANPVRAWISRSTSGRSTRGSRARTWSRSVSKLGGSSSLSSPVRVRVSRPFTCSTRTAALVGKLAAVR